MVWKKLCRVRRYSLRHSNRNHDPRVQHFWGRTFSRQRIFDPCAQKRKSRRVKRNRLPAREKMNLHC
jgi:hypothetical protein